VVLGALHGAVHGSGAPDPFFAVTDDRVLATALKIDGAFHTLYGINAQDKDPANLPLGTAIGRYPEDHYSGNGPVNLGNPWFLATDAFAEFYYRSAQAFEKAGSVTVSALNAPFFGHLRTASRMSPLKAGQQLRAGTDGRFEALVQGLRDTGDAYLRRVKLHADPNGSLSEQFNRDTGYMQSAGELTWSHASLLTAEWARE
jgi:glucoamylase